MGLSAAGIFVKTNSTTLSHEEIVTTLFGTIDKVMDEHQGGFDIREQGKVIVRKRENGYNIASADIAQKILVEGNRSEIAKVYGLFGDSLEFIIAYMHYDSGDSFGFRVIENEETIRYRYSLGGEYITKEFGLPLDEELEVLNKPLYCEVEEDGDEIYREIYHYADEQEKFAMSYDFYNSHLAEKIMQKRLGFTFHNEYFDKDSKFFIVI